MALGLPRRVAIAALVALPVALALALFVEACGAVHGAPKCGVLSYAAVPFVVLALVLESLAFSSPQNDHTVRVLLWLTIYVVAVLLCFLVLWLRSIARRG
jgi:hypothetical protein